MNYLVGLHESDFAHRGTVNVGDTISRDKLVKRDALLQQQLTALTDDVVYFTSVGWPQRLSNFAKK